MYILFEGIDTCGKSTQVELLKEPFPDAVYTKEPGATEFGRKAREILLGSTLHSKRAELLLFLSDRSEHFEEVIKPNLERLIISDRGFISGIAYALANDTFAFDELVAFNRFALEDHLPDLVILFETNLETLQARMAKKSLDTIEKRGLGYLLEVQKHMIRTTQKLNLPHLIVDATNPIEQIHQQITTTIRNHL
jgi:dTMP kinase